MKNTRGIDDYVRIYTHLNGNIRMTPEQKHQLKQQAYEEAKEQEAKQNEQHQLARHPRKTQ